MSAQPKSALSYYYSGIAAFAIAMVVAFFMGGTAALSTVLFLIFLEVALSFDNAVVNEGILKHWDEKWRRIFLTVGIFVAVVLMRGVFPPVVVSATTGMNPWAAFMLSLQNPEGYAHIMHSVHHQVSGFGAAFLMMVAINYFIDDEHDAWVEWLEEKLIKAGQIEGVAAGITLLTFLLISRQFDDAAKGMEFLIAGVLGLVTFIASHGLAKIAGGAGEGADKIIKGSIGGFIYIEMLDASFSFDGVIGAFAVTNYLPYIILGLGVGALFVRDMTIHFVETGVLGNYRFVGSGAHYAIGALVVIMIYSAMGHEVPEWVSGLAGLSILGSSVLHSIVANKKEASQANLGYPAADA